MVSQKSIRSIPDVNGFECRENGTDGGSPNFGKYTSNPMYEIGIGSTTPLK